MSSSPAHSRPVPPTPAMTDPVTPPSSPCQDEDESMAPDTDEDVLPGGRTIPVQPLAPWRLRCALAQDHHYAASTGAFRASP